VSVTFGLTRHWLTEHHTPDSGVMWAPLDRDVLSVVVVSGRLGQPMPIDRGYFCLMESGLSVPGVLGWTHLKVEDMLRHTLNNRSETLGQAVRQPSQR